MLSRKKEEENHRIMIYNVYYFDIFSPPSTFPANIAPENVPPPARGYLMDIFRSTCRNDFKKAAGRPWDASLRLLILRNFDPRPWLSKKAGALPPAHYKHNQTDRGSEILGLCFTSPRISCARTTRPDSAFRLPPILAEGQGCKTSLHPAPIKKRIQAVDISC